MKMKLFAPVFALLLLTLSACASTGGGGAAKATMMIPAIRALQSVYVWDADGYPDINLLRALKAEAAKELRAKGLLVSNDQNSTQAYVKITVLKGYDSVNKGRSYLKARLYFMDAAGENIFYDKTASASLSGDRPTGNGGEEGPGWPVKRVVHKLLSDYPKVAGK